jgi:hypothetical protein
MSTELIIVILQLVAQYGPVVVNQILQLGKSSEAPTLEQLTRLQGMVKASDSYFVK